MESNLSVSPGGAVGAAVIDQLARTKGWTRFLSVLLWIGSVFLIMGALAMMAMGAFAGSIGDEVSQQFAAIGGAVVVGVFYLLLALVYIYPALKLGKFSSRVSDLMNVPSESNLIAALNEQRAFWKYMGIWMIIGIALYFLIIIGAIITVGVAGAAAAAKGG